MKYYELLTAALTGLLHVERNAKYTVNLLTYHGALTPHSKCKVSLVGAYLATCKDFETTNHVYELKCLPRELHEDCETLDAIQDGRLSVIGLQDVSVPVSYGDDWKRKMAEIRDQLKEKGI